MKTLVILLLLLPIALFAQEGRPQLDKAPADSPLAASLWGVARAFHEDGAKASAQLVEQIGLMVNDRGELNVEVVLLDGNAIIGQDFLGTLPVNTELTWRNRASVWVAPGSLRALANAVRNKAFVSALLIGKESGNFEGQAAQNADEYVSAGMDGIGIELAVIDYSFDTLTQAISTGNMSSNIDTTTYVGSTIEAGGEHGTGCMEAAFDNAPGASFHAYRVGFENATHFGNAINDCISKGVDIISLSIGPHNQGWADDSGPFCQAVTTACNAGILVFVAAGNEALRHYQSDFVNGSGTTMRHDWDTTAVTDTLNSITLAQGATVWARLQWDQDPPGNPYDLLVVNQFDQTLNVAPVSSNGYEDVSYTNNTGAAQNVGLVVQANVSNPPEFELFSRNQNLQYAIATSSIETPGNTTHPNQLTVGAVDQALYGQPPGVNVIRPSSSRGPTNSGGLAPDIAGPTIITTFSNNGTFGGTSCAAPNAAGAAAALWSAHPDYTATGIRQLILRMAELYKDWGTPGLDMTYGHGGLFLNTYQSNTEYIYQYSGNINGTSQVPYSSIQQADQYSPQNSKTFFLGGTFAEPPPGNIIDTPMIYRSVQQAATVE